MSLMPMTRKRRILLVAVSVLTVYVGSYFVLSRRGLRVAQEWEIEGFVYTRQLLDSDAPFSPGAVRREAVLFFAYLPVHLVDRLFGGPRYAHVWGPM
jgi:hypothetical protein